MENDRRNAVQTDSTSKGKPSLWPRSAHDGERLGKLVWGSLCTGPQPIIGPNRLVGSRVLNSTTGEGRYRRQPRRDQRHECMHASGRIPRGKTLCPGWLWPDAARSPMGSQRVWGSSLSLGHGDLLLWAQGATYPLTIAMTLWQALRRRVDPGRIP